MIHLQLTEKTDAALGSLGIGALDASVLVSPDVMNKLSALGVRSGEELYSILTEYPQALSGVVSLKPEEFLLSVSDAVARISPLMPPNLLAPRKSTPPRFGAVIPQG